MGGRYYVTGAQLGMIKAILEASGQSIGLINEIEEKQYIGKAIELKRMMEKR